ncbi:MAG: tyrosine-type recombinase/integrase [Bacteroidota bacterium]|jgi:integrase/recombinase XerD
MNHITESETVCVWISVESGVLRIFLKFQYDEAKIVIARQLKKRLWHSDQKVWSAAYCKENILKIESDFQVNVPALSFEQEASLIFNYKEKMSYKENVKMKSEAVHGIEKLKNWMLNQRYSVKTIDSYSDSLAVLFRYYHNKNPDQLITDDISFFNNNYIIRRGLSVTYQNQFISALKLYYTVNKAQHFDFSKLERPRRSFYLPDILSKHEVQRLLDVVTNLKHFTMLAVIYSAGLRCGELLRLRINDLDFSRKLILIRRGKGGRDRFVPLSTFIEHTIKTYLEKYEPNKDLPDRERYLFEGQGDTKYSSRSLQLVLKKAVKQSGLNKQITLHTLRHSYATHLMESGTNLRYIQELLGHSSPKTTQIYTHVSNYALNRIASPIDSFADSLKIV